MNLKYPNHPQGATTSISAIKLKTEISVFGSQAFGRRDGDLRLWQSKC